MYETGLGQFNIAISSSDAVRRFLASQQYGTFGTKTPTTTTTTATPIRTPTTTFIPRTPTTTFKPVAVPLPVLKPTVSTAPIAPRPKPVVLNVGSGGGTATPQIAEETSAMSGAFSFTKSPLPLILAGLAALFLLNKKGR